MDDIKKRFQTATAEHEGTFGHNIELNFLPKFRKMEKLGGEIEFDDYHSLYVKLPSNAENARQLLIYILTKLPGATRAQMKRGRMYIEWHY